MQIEVHVKAKVPEKHLSYKRILISACTTRGTCFDVLVLEEVVEDVDGRVAGEQHVFDELGGAAVDDHRARRTSFLYHGHEQLQADVDHIQRRPSEVAKGWHANIIPHTKWI